MASFFDGAFKYGIEFLAEVQFEVALAIVAVFVHVVLSRGNLIFASHAIGKGVLFATLEKVEGVTPAELAKTLDVMCSKGMDCASIVSEVESVCRKNVHARSVAYVNDLLNALLGYATKTADAAALHFSVVEGVIAMLPSLRITPDGCTYEVIAQVNFARRRFDDVIRLDSEMRTKGIDQTTATRRVFLRTTLQLNDLEGAIDWFRMLEADVSVTVPGSIRVQLVQLACREQRLDALLREFDSGRLKLATETLNALFAASPDEHAFRRIERLGSRLGVARDAGTYHSLVKAAGSDNACLRKLLEEATAKKVACSDDTVQSILLQCGTNRDPHLCSQLAAYLCSVAAVKQATLFAAILCFFVSAGMAREAYDVYKENSRRITGSGAGAKRLQLDVSTVRALVIVAVSCDDEGVVAEFVSTSNMCIADWAAMVHGCAKKGYPDAALAIFSVLEENGTKMTHAVWNVVLDACVERRDFTRAEELMTRMKAEGLADTISYNTFIKAALQQNKYDCARELLGDMRAAGFNPTDVSYNELLRYLSRDNRRHRRSDMWEVIETMKANCVTPNHITCSIVLKVLGPNTPYDEIERTMALTDAVETADEVFLCSLLEACVRVKLPWLVSKKLTQFHVNGGIQITGAQCYESLIKAYGYVKDVESALKCWHEMRLEQIKPSSLTLGCLVENLVANNNPDGAHKVVSEIRQDRSCACKLNAVVYGSVLKGYGRAQRLEDVLKVYEEMIDQNIHLQTYTYNIVIDACARNAEVALAHEIVDAMKANNFAPDLITYSTLIKMHCHKGDIKSAFATMDELRAQQSVQADEILYQTLLAGCTKYGGADDSEQLVDEMLDVGVMPNPGSFVAVLTMMGKAGRVERAFDFVEKATQKYNLKMTTHLGSALVDMCLRQGDTKRALDTCEKMLKNRVRLEAWLWAGLIHEVLRTGDAPMAANIMREFAWTSRNRHDAEVGAASVFEGDLIGAVFRALHAEGQVSTIRALAADLQAAGIDIDGEEAASGGAGISWRRRRRTR
mmetsp:Transcript_105630/g.297143  ORF Transcript_105630/g.297143 Transcript_105630/m.297143 type:complete len:1022 (+) Transcript_105630:125-3190(+)|eukprot:CAMPEP_0117482188 /NCGR_PEP_ID=MMETSP0784-20121206/13291_1 /TAXON_ID=39447 /ORGANISM="" /LENGTH=1021 /DNA_ID=CAMNT_0005276677 /DNA_START=105 /DNA_END=3170 /DNA_ORIENTATION=+